MHMLDPAGSRGESMSRPGNVLSAVKSNFPQLPRLAEIGSRYSITPGQEKITLHFVVTAKAWWNTNPYPMFGAGPCYAHNRRNAPPAVSN